MESGDQRPLITRLISSLFESFFDLRKKRNYGKAEKYKKHLKKLRENKMNIKDIRKKKIKTEEEIREFVSKQINDFEKETGLVVPGLIISFCHIEEFIETRLEKKSFIKDVEIEVKI